LVRSAKLERKFLWNKFRAKPEISRRKAISTADGKTDFAVFRNGTLVYASNYGGICCRPIRLERRFTGNRRLSTATIKPMSAVFRPSNGAWYLLRSQGGFTGIGFGASTDKPVPNAYLPQ
jgi:hypothetical protein